MDTAEDGEDRGFDPKRLEKLALSRRALSLEVEANRYSRWNLDPNADAVCSISLEPRPSPKRVSLQTLRKIKSATPRSPESTQEQREPPAPVGTVEAESKPSHYTPDVPPECQSRFLTVDQTALDALADLGRRHAREPTLSLSDRQTEQYSIHYEQNQRNDPNDGECRPQTITSLSYLLSPKHSPLSKLRGPCLEVSSCVYDTNSCHCRGNSHTKDILDDRRTVSPRAPTMAFLSRLLFEASSSNDTGSPTSNTTLEPSTPTGIYSHPSDSEVSSFGDELNHRYLLQLGQILGTSQLRETTQSTDGEDCRSTTSSLSSLQNGMAAPKTMTKRPPFRRLALLSLVVLAGSCLTLSRHDVPLNGTGIWLCEIPCKYRKVDDPDRVDETHGRCDWSAAQPWRSWRTAVCPALQKVGTMVRKGEARLVHQWQTLMHPFLKRRFLDLTSDETLTDRSDHVISRRRRTSGRPHVAWSEGRVQTDKPASLPRVHETSHRAMLIEESAVRPYSMNRFNRSDLLRYLPQILRTEMEPDVETSWGTDMRGVLETAGSESMQQMSHHRVTDSNFWKSSHLGAPFLSTGPFTGTPWRATRPCDINQACGFALILRQDQCYEGFKKDFCCDSDWAEISIRVPSREETMSSAVDDSDGFLHATLMDVVGEFLEERRRRRAMRTR